MPSVGDFGATQVGVVRLAERELNEFFKSLDFENDLEKAVRATKLFVPQLVMKYGEIGAALAADFYDELRLDAGVKSRFKAILAAPLPEEQVFVSTSWAVGPLFREDGIPDVSAAVSNLTDVTDRLVKQRYRDTVNLNTLRDPAQARWARVPSGAETCKFCLMLASRGAVYSGSAKAKAAHKYHGKCDCVPVPVWDDADLDRLKAETGYDPDEYYDRWQDAEEADKAASA